jgi:chaperone required for assembly of F1-ATPase
VPGPDPSSRLKRFYAKVEVAPAEGGFAVTLDGRTPRSPERAPLVLPTQGLADLVAAEWEAQGAEIAANTMPATRLAWTAIAFAGNPALKADAAARLASFAGSDLLCYLAEWPKPLVERQRREWGLVIDWAERALGLRFQQVQGVIHTEQPPETLARVEALVAAEDAFTLAALAAASQLFGSAILALALRHGELTPADAFARARLDESFQEESWGVDAQEAARAAELLGCWFKALGH